ncbi:MAG: mechanosensitive ion channel family protein [Gammaproteobacteria bacterium]|nr:MAG: mechanosensitive ion channel family protein [Gammaproteobacteria bacterium]
MPEEIDTLQSVMDQVTAFFIAYGFQILGAVIILLVGFRLAGWAGNAVLALCQRRELDITLAKFFAGVTRLTVLVFVVIIAMGKFGISIAPFIAALGAVAFGSSLALQGPLSNYGAGLGIILTRPFAVGDTLRVRGVTGVVEEIRLGATFLRTEDGETIIVPNGKIAGEVLTNSYHHTVVEQTLGIAYDADPGRAIDLVEGVLAEHPGVTAEPAPQVGIHDFGDSAILLGLRYWAPTERYHQTRYAVNREIHQALKEEGITIPCPQREVRLLGGETPP